MGESVLKIINKSIIVVFSLMLPAFFNQLAAQDVIYSQFYRNPIYLNPSLTALQSCGRAFVHYRNAAWGPLEHTTYSLSFDLPFEDTKSGFGGVFQWQEEGLMRQGFFSFQFSRKVSIAQDVFLTMGVEAGGIFRSYNTSEMVLPSDLLDVDAGQDNVNPGSTFIYDIGAGIGLNYKIHYLGFASKHITNPQVKSLEVNSFLHRRYTLHYAARIPYRLQGARDGFFAPQLIFEAQNGNNHLSTGVYAFYNNIGAGLWIRNHFPFQTSFLVIMGTIKSRNFEFSYSYDMPINGSGALSGAHEIAVSYYLTDLKKKYSKLKRKNCLSF